MSAKPKLAYLISQYPAVSHTFILREIVELRRLGFTIRPASINPPDRPADQLTAVEREEAQTTWCVKGQGAGGALSALLGTLSAQPKGLGRGFVAALRLGGLDPRKILKNLAYFAEAVMLGRWMQREQLHHLHVHFATPAAMVGLLAKTIFNIGFSFTVHGPDEFYDAPGYRLTEKLEAADFVICISHYARSQIMKLSPVAHWGKYEICRLGVDPGRFAPKPAKPAAETFELLCVGRLTPAKGQHILLDALGLLIAAGRKVHLTFVGNGPDRASLESQTRRLGLSNSVNFAGAVNQDRILDFYGKADAFVLPSFAEGLPVVLMEAMAMEVPCVTTHITGVPELIQHGVNGCLTAPSDVEGLAKAIEDLMDHPEASRQIAQSGRAKVLADYNLSQSVERLAGVFARRLPSTN
ncbi:MAG: glycosyltransferase family 4 protein [Proteobacteria bacterium]|nr:glycosyltransferase family 4 protein [Pseudomonadota bacterium]